jgi:hypothetical protein
MAALQMMFPQPLAGAPTLTLMSALEGRGTR